MSKVVFIKQNSPEVRQKLKNAGFSICICANFPDSVWLDYHPDNPKMPYDIHGVGYTDPTEGMEHLEPEERIKEWLTWEHHFAEKREFFDTVDDFLNKYKINKIT